MPAGEGVSYGHAWTTPRGDHARARPVGYADGVPRALNVDGRMQVLLGGVLRPVVGRVCMDQVWSTAATTTVARGRRGRPVRAGDGQPTAQDWADELDTIHYEVVTGVHGNRVTRTVQRGAAA